MRKRFDEELDELLSELLFMASLAEKAVETAILALQNRDAALAQKVIDEDVLIDQFEIKIEKICISLLTYHETMAGSLRRVVSALKINNDLERIGDHAVNIAENTLQLQREPLFEPLRDIPLLAKLAQHMVRDAIDAFVHRDAATAIAVCRKDDEIDALNRQILRDFITHMANAPGNTSRGLSLILVSKNLERIADLSTNIAEEVVYMVEARTIKHVGLDERST